MSTEKVTVTWSPEAEARVKNAPFMIRPIIRRSAEKTARQRGVSLIDEPFLDAIKKKAMKKS